MRVIGRREQAKLEERNVFKRKLLDRAMLIIQCKCTTAIKRKLLDRAMLIIQCKCTIAIAIMNSFKTGFYIYYNIYQLIKSQSGFSKKNKMHCVPVFKNHFILFIFPVPKPGVVARSEACPLGMQAAPSSNPTSGTFFQGVETWS